MEKEIYVAEETPDEQEMFFTDPYPSEDLVRDVILGGTLYMPSAMRPENQTIRKATDDERTWYRERMEYFGEECDC